MTKSLIAYFSHSGNTEVIANMIKENVGCDLFKIETVEKYPSNYNDVVNVARKEQNADSRPKLARKVENMDSYNVIYIGFPNWWGTIPMCVFTFFESYDFSGKTIIPFCTNEGSGMGRSEHDIKKLCPKSNVLSGLPIRGSSVHGSEKEVSRWLKGMEV
ncbi:flavodoxin [Clostridium algifaecis]|uniref:Flavodoxin n=1 Tax=Clostridium algifaecis TaxID=1472040 RepID=A0ABS4KTA2_9CLOT|nr:flavodoxin [Clostridium algifaecis]MBP2032079.1 flavodoxin [Clostridium algifaecis]